MRTILFAILISVALRVESAPPTKPSLGEAQIDSIEAAVGAAMAAKHIPGLSMAVVRDGQLVWKKSFGVANRETKEPTTDATVYRIASSTKPIAATAAMQLVEKGKLDLDAPVQKYAPAYPKKKYTVTTRHLLSHTSGVRNYRRGEPERTDHFDRLTDAFVIFKDDSLEFEPDTRYMYSTFGYTMLGAVIEGASGMSFPDYLRENIFKPAGMTITQPDDARKNIPNRAQGYTPITYAVFNGAYEHGRPMDSSYKLPAGGLVSTAEDMARFTIAVMDGVLIKPETLAVMAEEHKTKDGTPTGYGFGWYAGNKREPAGSIWHGGVQSGFTAEMWLIPEKRFAVVILTNLEGGGALGLAPLANKVGDIVLK